jgi:predicted ATPase
MTVIRQVGFQPLNGTFKNINLLHPERINRRRFETTIITGQNGSNKSTLLKQLVQGLAAPMVKEDDGGGSLNPDRDQVLCISGSMADRFPEKGFGGGSRTTLDVPNYTYVGQRVGSNLLSKKAPLEAMLSFALANSRLDRFGWSFFRDAHSCAGVRPSAKYLMHTRTEFRGERLDLIGIMQRKAPETDLDRGRARALTHVSDVTAQWLLDEFTYDEFIELQNWVTGKGNRALTVTLSEGGVDSSRLSPNALRLGLLTELIRLRDVSVNTVNSDVSFSAFELSSGEYHMLSTILAIGFSLERKAVLLIDEPENNLHPQWQRDLMSSVFDICDQVEMDGHVIVSTHSPLIVGSAPEGSSVVDLSFEEPRLSLVSFGASSDELLLSLFGIGSSRNSLVVDTVQRAVSLVEKGDFTSKEFEALVPKLRSIRGALTSTDPMISIIDALLDEEQGG